MSESQFPDMIVTAQKSMEERVEQYPHGGYQMNESG